MTAGEGRRKAVAQTLGPAPPARDRIDWSARTRGSIGDAARYTRFVTIMKRALPLAAGAILAAVIAYSMQPRQPAQKLPFTFESIGRIDNDLAMIKPRLTGKDSDGNPFVITADSAIQDGNNVRRARLKNIEADLTMKDGRWLTITAPSGFVDTEAHKLWLGGAIALFSDDGNELHTTQAFVDLARGFVTGDHTITGQGPQGTVRADRFRMDHRFMESKTRAPGVRGRARPGENPMTFVHRANPTIIHLYGHVQMSIDIHGQGK